MLLVLELAECSLYQYLHNDSPPHPRRPVRTLDGLVHKLAIIYDILNALLYVHSLGIIHRDIKSPNVLVFNEGRGEVFKLADFGAAKDLAAEPQSTLMTTAGGAAQPHGTYHYMAPEILSRARDYSPASDVYALGVLINEVLSGTLPFAKLAVDQIISDLLQGHRPTLVVLADLGVQDAALGRQVAAMVERCWAKDKKSRPTLSVLKASLDEMAVKVKVRKDPSY
jgi:serine/threonine protein kinase